MKVLVTGATGFIGNYVIQNLLNRGHQVIATSVNSQKAKEKHWINSVVYVQHDIKTILSENLYEKFQKPDLLIHLAWGNLINFKSENHLNIELPFHILFLNNLISNGLNDLTCIGTCLEYGLKEGKLSEDMSPEPVISYPKAKNILRLYLQELKSVKNFNFKWMRIFYLYGEGQSSKSILSQLQKSIDNNEEYFNMSKGDQTRDYLPVESVSENIVKFALQNKVQGVVNCSSNQPITIIDLVKNYLDKLGIKIKLNTGYYPYLDYEPKNFWGSDEKLKLL